MSTASSRLQLPRRLRLVKLLRAHGLRNVERMREDELRAALDRLPLALASPEGVPVPSPRVPAPSSDMNLRAQVAKHEPSDDGEGVAAGAAPMPEGDWDDPHAEPRFREPRAFLPEGQRTFLRLIAIDHEQVLVTWDADEETRSRAHGGVKLRLHVLDDESAAPVEHACDLLPGRWYLAAPGERLTLQVELLNGAGEVLATSNPAIVPPVRPAPPGPLVWATLPPSLDRRALADRDLLTEDAVPEGGSLDREGSTPEVGASSRYRPSGLPSSGEAIAWGPPSSHSLPSSHSVPSSSSSSTLHRRQE